MTSALGRIAMGAFEKVILVFDEHFYKGWKENMDEISLLFCYIALLKMISSSYG